MIAPRDRERVERILDRLDARLEQQTFLRGADAPHAVALVGAFHRAAGDVERALDHPATSQSYVRNMARILRRMIRTHAAVVAARAAALRP